MNENKTAKMLNRLFHFILLLSFSYIFLSIIFFGYRNGGKRYSEESKPLVILGFLVLLVIFTAVYIYVQKYNRKNILV